MITSKKRKPILHIFVRLTGAPKPLVRAAAESSSPILKEHIITGTILNSMNFPTPPLPRRMPRIRMASLIEAVSSFTVGKNLNTTDRGITSAFGICIFSIAAINSLTVVVEIKYHDIIILGKNLLNMTQQADSSMLGTPVILGRTRRLMAVKIAYAPMHKKACLILFDNNSKIEGSSISTHLITFIRREASPNGIIRATLTISTSFVRGSR